MLATPKAKGVGVLALPLARGHALTRLCAHAYAGATDNINGTICGTPMCARLRLTHRLRLHHLIPITTPFCRLSSLFQPFSFRYMAPEILRREKGTFAVDMWSLGVIMFALLTGSMPFVDDDVTALFQLIVKGQYDMAR